MTHSIIGGALARALAQAMRDEPFDLVVLSASAARKRAMRRLVWRSSVALCVADAPTRPAHASPGTGASARRFGSRDQLVVESAGYAYPRPMTSS